MGIVEKKDYLGNIILNEDIGLIPLIPTQKKNIFMVRTFGKLKRKIGKNNV